ncbi:MAG: hypothetical protein ABUL63_04295, partial [Acidobacteriota bacterium]
CGMALVVAFTGETTLGVVLAVLEFSVVFGMRRMGMTRAARSLAEAQRQELETEVLGLDDSQGVEEKAPERKVLPFSR